MNTSLENDSAREQERRRRRNYRRTLKFKQAMEVLIIVSKYFVGRKETEGKLRGNFKS